MERPGGGGGEPGIGVNAPPELADAVRRFIVAENQVKVIRPRDRVDEDYRPLAEASTWTLADARSVIEDNSYLSSLGALDLSAVLLWTRSADRAVLWACFQQDEVFTHTNGEVFKHTAPRHMIYELHRDLDRTWKVNYRVRDGDRMMTPKFDPDGDMPRRSCK